MDILDYEIEVDEAMLELKVMKLLLQPLVENALYHGIKNKREKGIIKITGTLIDEDNNIRFAVFDNGAGMQEETLKEITRELEDDSTGINRKDRGFGLYNVHKRIQLYYGREYGLSVKSSYMDWTEVALIIRAVR